MNDVTASALLSEERRTAPAIMDRGSITLFLVLTLTLSSAFWVLMIRAGHLGAGAGHYLVGLMWAPATAAFLTLRFRHKSLRSLGLSSIGGRSVLLGYGLPLFYASVAYGLV